MWDELRQRLGDDEFWELVRPLAARTTTTGTRSYDEITAWWSERTGEDLRRSSTTGCWARRRQTSAERQLRHSATQGEPQRPAIACSSPSDPGQTRRVVDADGHHAALDVEDPEVEPLSRAEHRPDARVACRGRREDAPQRRQVDPLHTWGTSCTWAAG